VPLDEERRRVLPLVEALVKRTALAVSVDTSKAALADEALAAGAHVINDVTAGADPEMPGVVARHGAGVILMHMRGTPATMQDDPQYVDVLGEIAAYLEERAGRFRSAGVGREQIALDPGIGFGKTAEHNLEILVRLGELAALGYPVCLGVSRKGFLGQITGRPRLERAMSSAAAACYCLARRSVHLLRVHDVGPHRDAVLMMAALVRAETGVSASRQQKEDSETGG
jgi:dihydropteroate synthase